MKRKTLFEGKFLRVLSEKTWEFVQRRNCTGIVVIVAVSPEGKAIFVEQHRQPVGKNVIEWPAGLVNDHEMEQEESMETAAKRELEEETGYRAKAMKHLITGPVSSGLSSDSISFFLATGLKKVSAGGGVDIEDIRVHEVPLRKAEAWLRQKQKQGFLVDPKVYAGLYFLNKTKR